jgi:hypothetical protein
MRSLQRKRTPGLAGPLPKTETRLNLPHLIAPYGHLISWDERRTGLSGGIFEAKVQLTPSPECEHLTDDREVRTELYVQAELLIACLEAEHFVFYPSPGISIDSDGGFIIGTVELHIRTE